MRTVMEVAAIANLVVFYLLINSAASATANHITNVAYIVGGKAGWSFNSTTNCSATNYTKWAASETFKLGDYLLFRNIVNETVIQTYNHTVYQSCDFDEAVDEHAFSYGRGNTMVNATTWGVLVPLTKQGSNFFFSDAYNGSHCRNGMAFEIQVMMHSSDSDQSQPSSSASTLPSNHTRFSFPFFPLLLILALSFAFALFSWIDSLASDE